MLLHIKYVFISRIYAAYLSLFVQIVCYFPILIMGTLENMPSFSKVSSGFGNVDKNLTEYHKGAYTSDGKLWLASLKGVEQPTFSFYHRTLLVGGYLLVFDIASKSWSKHAEFDEIDTNENREDELFSWQDRLFVLVYSRYKGLKYRQLLEWKKDKKWAKVDSFKVDDGCNITPEHKDAHTELVLATSSPDSNQFYFITTADSSRFVRVSKLELNQDSKGNIDKAHVTHVMDIQGEGVSFLQQMGHVTMATVHENNLYCIGVWHGCGYHWDPEHLLIVDLKKKKHTVLDKESPAHPRWAFSGPNAALYVSNGKWTMVSGSEARGESQTKFSPEVWHVKLDPTNPTWKKDEITVPKEVNDNEMIVIGNGKDTVYICDKKNVFEGKF